MSMELLDASKILFQLSYKAEVIVLNTVNSTNQYLLDNIDYIYSGFVCLAEEQTCGRGRYGRYWLSPFGKNVYLSFYWLLLNYKKIVSLTMLSVIVSLVVGEVLQSLGIVGVQVKWPNDIYFQGKKLAGVLIEIVNGLCNHIHVVIGIGINVNKIFRFLKEKDNIPIISLEEIGVSIDRNVLAAKVINSLYISLIQFQYYGCSSFFSPCCSLGIFYNQKI